MYSTYKPLKHKKALQISISEARSRRFGLIIDVRTQKERDRLGYYPNSIPVAINDIRSVQADVPNRNTHILVYSGDNRAAVAAETLYGLGYYNTRYIADSYVKLMPGY